jgi:nucleoside-diphosphate-sugar epimerase
MGRQSVIVTGATGVIGRWAPPLLLKRNFEIHLFGRRLAERSPQMGSWFRQCSAYEADLLKPYPLAEQIRQCRASHLLHLAWHQMDPATVYVSKENLEWVEASLRLIRAFAEAGGRRIVVAGTCAEYDWKHGLLNEDVTPREPSSSYGLAKALLRQELDAEASKLGLSVAWTHIFSCFGPGERPARLVPNAIATLLAGRVLECTEGLQQRDYLYAEDIAAALVEILHSEIKGTVNIASGQGRTVRDIVGLIAQSVGRPELVRFGAKSRLTIDPDCIVGTTRRLTQEVGFLPRYTLKEGIDRTIQFFRNHVTGGGAAARLIAPVPQPGRAQ